MPRSSNKGFTLLEIAIVLLIVALIAGGVSTGASLIREARLRSVLLEYDRYVKAIQEFNDKYKSLPGDMTNAETMWGDSGDNCDTASLTLRTATCNGDGNSHIGDSTAAGVTSDYVEWFTAWQHLSNAGFIDGIFSGTSGTAVGTPTPYIRQNVPASQLKPGGWSLYYYLQSTVDIATLWRGQYGHTLAFGSASSGAGQTTGVILTPAEALSIDQKIDDGKPGVGIVRSHRPSGIFQYCTENNTSAANLTYNDGYKQSACSLLFVLGF